MAGPATSHDGARLRELDALRCLAMTGVFVYHFGLFASPLLALGPGFGAAPTTWGARVIPNLQAGVEIFFVLSGYLIYTPFARAKVAGSANPDLIRYALRRSLRIYPAYWVALVVLLVRHDIYVNGAVNFFKHATLTHLYFSDFGRVGTREPGLSVSWTLVVEVSFYVFVPVWANLVARRISITTELWVLAGLALFGMFLRWWIPYHHVWSWVALLPPALAALAPGMMMAIADASRDRWSPGVARWFEYRRWWWIGAAATFVLMTRTAYGSQVFAILVEARYQAWHRLLAPILAICIVAPVVLGPRTRAPSRVLAHPILLWIGVVSYGAYLWHHPVMYSHIDVEAVNSTTAFNDLLLLAGLYVFVLVIAAGSWRLVERPALALSERLARRDRWPTARREPAARA